MQIDLEEFHKAGKEVGAYLQARHRWDKDDAQTIFHDAYLLALKQVKEGQISEITLSYLKTVAKNIGANLARKQSRQPDFSALVDEVSGEMECKWAEAYGINVFEETPTSKAAIALRAFSMLKENCQELIRLRYVEELNHQAITERLGKFTKNGSKNQLGRCLKYWKKLFYSLLKF